MDTNTNCQLKNKNHSNHSQDTRRKALLPTSEVLLFALVRGWREEAENDRGVAVVVGFLRRCPKNQKQPMCQSVRRCRRRTTFRRYGSAGGGGAGGDEGGVLPAGQQRWEDTRRRSSFSVWSLCYAPSWPPWTPPRRRNLTSHPGPREATRRPSLSSRKLTRSSSSGSSTRRTLLPCTGVSVFSIGRIF